MCFVFVLSLFCLSVSDDRINEFQEKSMNVGSWDWMSTHRGRGWDTAAHCKWMSVTNLKWAARIPAHSHGRWDSPSGRWVQEISETMRYRNTGGWDSSRNGWAKGWGRILQNARNLCKYVQCLEMLDFSLGFLKFAWNTWFPTRNNSPELRRQRQQSGMC